MLSTQELTAELGVGVDRANLSVVGYADTRPVAGNDTEKGRAANRRIEIVCARKTSPKRQPNKP